MATLDPPGARFRYEPRSHDAPSGRVAYFDEGEGEALVFVHGLVGSFTHFQYILPALAGRYRLIGVDMPGCGESGHADAHQTIDTYASAVLSLLDARGVRRATLIGHSAGGLVVSRVAELSRDRVARLVMMNPAGLRGYVRPLRVAARVVLQPPVVAVLLGVFVERILDHVFCARNDYTRHFAAEQTGRYPKHKLLYGMGRVFHDIVPDLMRPGVLDARHALEMPVLVIWGDTDRLVPLKKVKAAVGRLPRAELQVIHACGHMPMIEAPEETLRLLGDFLGASA
ncbi:MAG: alpha/beta fold hydrolase [Polyangiaceae bacterium]|nr:alpha/beta fold hydrolase [Polyangiaceae bacterium]